VSKRATSDYAPLTNGFPGAAAPVEKIYPWLVTFLELDDGKTIVAADGADEIEPAADGKSLTVDWRLWVVPGATAGDFVDAGLVSEVTWTLHGNGLRRVESLTSSRPLNAHRLWLTIPSRYDHIETSYLQGARIDRLLSQETTLEVQVNNRTCPSTFPPTQPAMTLWVAQIRGPLPLHLILQSKSFSLAPALPKHWELSLTTQRGKWRWYARHKARNHVIPTRTANSIRVAARTLITHTCRPVCRDPDARDSRLISSILGVGVIKGVRRER
jgi:hypothetical protein